MTKPIKTNGMLFSAPVGEMERVGTTKYIKDVIKNGTYVQGDVRVPVDSERQDKWIDAFFSMTANGVKVPLFSDHGEDSQSERKNPSQRTIGYATDAFRKGDTLYVVHDFADQDCVTMAKRVDQVSVKIEKDVTDGEGRNYGEAITHITLTPKPVVPNQESFIPLTFSREEQTQETEKMDEKTLKALQDGFGLTELTEETFVDALVGEFSKTAARVKEMEKARTTLQASLDSANAEADKNKRPTLQPELIDALSEGVEAKLDTLVELSRITPATKGKLLELFGAENVQAVMLSRSVSKTDKSIAVQVCEILKDNDVVKTGSKTGSQAVELSREDAEQKATDQAEMIKQMAAMVDGVTA